MENGASAAKSAGNVNTIALTIVHLTLFKRILMFANNYSRFIHIQEDDVFFKFVKKVRFCSKIKIGVLALMFNDYERLAQRILFTPCH